MSWPTRSRSGRAARTGSYQPPPDDLDLAAIREGREAGDELRSLGAEPLEQGTGVVESDANAGVALEGLDHRQVGAVVGLGDDPAEVADRLMVVERESQADAAGHAVSSGGGGRGSRGGDASTSHCEARPLTLRLGVLVRSLNRFAKPVLFPHCTHPEPRDQPSQQPRRWSREQGSGRRRSGVEQVTRRVTIADVAERAGVSKTAVSFAFNNPDRLNAGTAQPDPRDRPRARLPARSGRPDADPAPDRLDRRPHAAGPLDHLHEPVLRDVQRGDRGASPRSAATGSTSSRRSTAP